MSILKSRLKEFQKMLENPFDEFCDSDVCILNFHLFGHMAEAI